MKIASDMSTNHFIVKGIKNSILCQCTLVLLKPDVIQRSLIGIIIKQIEDCGLHIVAQKMMLATNDVIQELYIEHVNKVFYHDICDYLTSGPIVVMVVSGPYAITCMRNLIGHNNPVQADARTIRGQFGISIDCNSIHSSDSLAAAEREISLFFTVKEIFA